MKTRSYKRPSSAESVTRRKKPRASTHLCLRLFESTYENESEKTSITSWTISYAPNNLSYSSLDDRHNKSLNLTDPSRYSLPSDCFKDEGTPSLKALKENSVEKAIEGDLSAEDRSAQSEHDFNKSNKGDVIKAPSSVSFSICTYLDPFTTSSNRERQGEETQMVEESHETSRMHSDLCKNKVESCNENKSPQPSFSETMNVTVGKKLIRENDLPTKSPADAIENKENREPESGAVMIANVTQTKILESSGNNNSVWRRRISKKSVSSKNEDRHELPCDGNTSTPTPSKSGPASLSVQIGDNNASLRNDRPSSPLASTANPYKKLMIEFLWLVVFVLYVCLCVYMVTYFYPGAFKNFVFGVCFVYNVLTLFFLLVL